MPRYRRPLTDLVDEGIVAALEPHGEMPVVEEGADHSPPGTSQVEDLEPGIIADPFDQLSIKPEADRVVVLATARVERVVRTHGDRVLRRQVGDLEVAGLD